MLFVRHTFLPAVLATVLLSASVAVAQGYDGLFADEPATPAARSRTHEQPQGYQGLIPGAVPQQAPSATAPVAGEAAGQQQAAPSATRARPVRVAPGAGETTAGSSVLAPASQAPLGALGMTPIRNSDDLRRLALVYGVDKNFDKIPDSMAAQFRLPETSIAFLQQPRMRINGMLPMERNVTRSIETAMAPLRSTTMSDAERQARIKNAIDSLQTIKRGLQVKSTTPASTYQVMGIPEIYVKEEREGIAKSLSHIDAALKKLQGR